jgi:hypothetical protein
LARQKCENNLVAKTVGILLRVASPVKVGIYPLVFPLFQGFSFPTSHHFADIHQIVIY